MALSCLTRSTSSFSPSGTKSNSPKSSETPHLPKQRKPAFLRQSSRYLPSLHCWQGLSPRAAQPPPPSSAQVKERSTCYLPPASVKKSVWNSTVTSHLLCGSQQCFRHSQQRGIVENHEQVWLPHKFITIVRQFNEGMRARVLD